MICPNCGTHVPDDALRCPACRCDLGRTTALPRPQGVWCARCGALVPDGAGACPSCGFPVPTPPRPPVGRPRTITSGNRAAPAPDPALDFAGASDDSPAAPADDSPASAMPDAALQLPLVRIESAIPSEPVPGTGEGPVDHLPRLRTFVAALVAALVVVGGGALVITHPWDPGASDSRAKTSADTSMAGFPGVVTELKGQDGRAPAARDVKSGDEATLAKLTDVYAQLGTLRDRVDANERLYASVAASADRAARDEGKAAADQLSLDISNLILSIADIDVTSGTYAADAQNMSTLGNYLRNRMDALDACWRRALAVEDPAARADEIAGYLSSSAAASWKGQFDQAYEAMAPQVR